MEVEELRALIAEMNDAGANDFVIAEVTGESRSRVYGLRRTVRDGHGVGRTSVETRERMLRSAHQVMERHLKARA